MRRLKSKEILKSVILFVLIISMLIFSVHLLVFRNLPNDTRGDFVGSLRTVLKSLGFTEFANMLPKPASSLDPYDNGSRFAFPSTITYNAKEAPLSTAYSMESTLKCYSDLKGTLLTALTAPAVSATKAEWDTLCGTQGSVIFDFGRELSLPLFLQVSGKGEGGFSGERFRYIGLLQTENGFSCLVKLSDGKYLRADSGVMPERSFEDYFAAQKNAGAVHKVTLVGRADSLLGLTVAKEFETGGNLEKQLVFPAEDGPSPEICIAQNPIYIDGVGFDERKIGNILSAFSYNPGNIKKYPSANGTEVYVENSSSIRVSPSGNVSFKATDSASGVPLSKIIGGKNPEKYILSDVLYAAQTLISSLGPELTGGGVASLRFEEAYYNKEEGALVVSFDYVIGGVRVSLMEEGAVVKGASLTYKNGYFVAGEINTRKYAASGPTSKSVNILQLAQAQALMGRPYAVTEFRYIDNFLLPQMTITPRYFSVS